MKKSKWLIALVAGIFAVTGCGNSNKDYDTVIDDARKKMEGLSNYSMTMEMNMGMKASGIEMTIPMTADMKIDNKSNIAQMNMSVSMFGMKVTTESYMDMSGEQTITYTKETLGEGWTKEYSENATNFQEFTSITENSSKIEKKKSDEKDADRYAVTISKEKMQDLLSESMGTMGSDTEGYEIASDVVVDLYINKKSGYITKMSMDLKDVIKMDESEGELTECTFTFTFADFDKLGTITIPEDVVANAVEESEDDFDYDYDYEYEFSDDEEFEM